jgi:hypothetical protein
MQLLLQLEEMVHLGFHVIAISSRGFSAWESSTFQVLGHHLIEQILVGRSWLEQNA